MPDRMWCKFVFILLSLFCKSGTSYLKGASNVFLHKPSLTFGTRFGAGTSTSLAVDKIENTNQLMSFGSRMGIKLILPTKDVSLAKLFLSDTNSIVSSTWEKGKFERLSDETYLLKFASLPIPGVDTISPEIEVDFSYIDAESAIIMKSGNWTLKGKTGTIKDSRFMKTFNIELDGMISVSSPGEAQNVVAEGWVKYRVQGEKPGVFKRAPAFILDKTISFIQGNVENFATRVFQGRLLRAFRDFSLASMRAKLTADAVTEIRAEMQSDA